MIPEVARRNASWKSRKTVNFLFWFSILISGNNSYVRCSIRRPPRPAGAQEDPLLSTSADGFHSAGVLHGPRVDSCYFEAMPDDGIAIHGDYSLVTDADFTSKRMWIGVTGAHGHSFITGDVLRLYDKGFEPTGIITIASVEEAAPSYKPPSNVSRSLSRFNFTQAKFIIITANEDLPPGCGFDFILSNSNHTGNGFSVTNNTLRNNRPRGMLIKASNGRIENNTIDGSTLGGIVVTPELYWASADYSHHLSIVNNHIANVAYTKHGFGGFVVGAINSSHHLALGYGHSQIVVRGNSFTNISFNNVWISSVDNLTFQGNVFNNPFGHDPWAKCCLPGEIPPETVVFVTKSHNLNFSQNCVYQPGSYAKSLLTSTETASGEGLKTGVKLCTHKHGTSSFRPVYWNPWII